ncbi:MAG: tetratricopeptide repeat protein [Planctomycetaceae bacterium]
MTPKQRERRRRIIFYLVAAAMLGVMLFYAKEIHAFRWGDAGPIGLLLLAVGGGICAWVIGAGAWLIRRNKQAILRSQALVQEERFDEAVQVLEKAISHRAVDAILYAQIAQVESSRGRPDAALVAVDAAEKAAGPSDWLESVRSNVYWQAGRKEESLEVCRQAVARWPESLTSRLSLGAILVTMEDVAAAATTLKELRQMIDDSPFQARSHREEWIRMVDTLTQQLHNPNNSPQHQIESATNN